MATYARQTNIDAEFGTKRGPSGAIVCKGCKRDLAKDPLETCYIVFVDKRALKNNTAHGLYCQECLDKGFPHPEIVYNIPEA